MSIGKKQIATFANRVKTLVPSYNQTHHPQKEEITITRTSVEEGVYAPFSQNSNLEGMYIKAHTINDGREDYALNQLVAIEDLEYRFLTPEGSSPFNNCVDNSNSAKTIEKGGRYEATLTPKAGFSKVPAGHLEMLIDANTWETVQGQTWSRSNSIGITVDPVLGNLRFVLENGEDCIYNLTLNKRVDGVQQSSIVLEKTCSDQINVDSLHTEAQFDEQGLTYKNVKESDGTTVITGTTTFCGNTTLYIDYDSEVTPTTHIIDTSGVNTECVNVSISPSNPYPIPNGLSRTLIFSPKSGKTIGSGQITMGNTVIDSWNEDRTEEFEVLVNNITADVIVTIGCGSTPDPRYTVNLEWRIQNDTSAEPLVVKEFTEVANTLINPESYKTYDGVNVESLGYIITGISPSESFNLTGDTTITYYCSPVTSEYTITIEKNPIDQDPNHHCSITFDNVTVTDNGTMSIQPGTIWTPAILGTPSDHYVEFTVYHPNGGTTSADEFDVADSVNSGSSGVTGDYRLVWNIGSEKPKYKAEGGNSSSTIFALGTIDDNGLFGWQSISLGRIFILNSQGTYDECTDINQIRELFANTTCSSTKEGSSRNLELDLDNIHFGTTLGYYTTVYLNFRLLDDIEPDYVSLPVTPDNSYEDFVLKFLDSDGIQIIPDRTISQINLIRVSRATTNPINPIDISEFTVHTANSLIEDGGGAWYVVVPQTGVQVTRQGGQYYEPSDLMEIANINGEDYPEGFGFNEFLQKIMPLGFLDHLKTENNPQVTLDTNIPQNAKSGFTLHYTPIDYNQSVDVIVGVYHDDNENWFNIEYTGDVRRNDFGSSLERNGVITYSVVANANYTGLTRTAILRIELKGSDKLNNQSIFREIIFKQDAL